MKKKLLPILLACMMGLIACGGEKKPDPTPDPGPTPGPTEVKVTGVTLDLNTLSLMESEYKTLTATVAPADATNKAITWSSDNIACATVDTSGKVSALGAGSAKISVTTVDGGFKAECAVTVSPITYDITITNKTELTDEWMKGGASRSVSLEIQPKGNIDSLINSGDIVISSSNPSVVACSGRTLTAKGAGDATISASYHGEVDTVDITVTGIVYDSIEDLVKCTLAKDETYESKEWNVYGTVVAILGTKSYVIQNNGYGFYVYKTIPEGAGIGSVIGVTSTATLYNGLVETKSVSLVEVLDESPEHIVARKFDKLDDITLENQNILVDFDGLAALGTSEPAVKDQSYRWCYITDGVTEQVSYSIYVNKYLDADVISAINDKLDKLEGKEAGHAYKCNLHSTLSSVGKTEDGTTNQIQFVPQSADEIELVEEAVVNPTDVRITNTETRLQAGQKLQMLTTFQPESCNQLGLTWESSDDEIATVSDSGVVKGLKTGKVTIKCTSTAVAEVTDSYELDIFEANYVMDFKDGERYYFGVEQTAKTLYATGEMSSYYGATTEKTSEAASTYVIAGTDENAGLYAIKVGSKYVAAVKSGSFVNYAYQDDPYYLDWDEEDFVFSTVVDDVEYFFGTDATHDTLSVYKADKLGFAGRLFPVYETKPSTEKSYALGFFLETKSTYYYATGAMVRTYYGGTDKDIKNAAAVSLLAGSGDNAGKYAVKVGTSYLDITKSGTHINFALNSSAQFLSWDKFKGSFYKTIDEVDYYAGSYGTYDTISAGTEYGITYPLRLFEAGTAPAPVVKPTAITINGADTVSLNGTATYTVSVTPTDADASVVWSVENGTGTATIGTNGLLKGTAAGSVTVKAVSALDDTVSATKAVTVSNQEGPDKGTKENPFSIAEVIEATKDLAEDEFYKGGATIYVKGMIRSFTKQDGWAKNTYLADSKTSSETFLAYNPNFTESVTTIYVGDTVVVAGPIKNYSGTIEISGTSDNKATFYSVTRGVSAITVSSDTPSFITVVKDGDTATNGSEFNFTVSTDAEHVITDVKVNGASVGKAAGSYKFTVAGDTTILVEGKGAGEKDPKSVALFKLGADCEAGKTPAHADGSAISEYTETVGSYTLTLGNLVKVYNTKTMDAKGNGCLKLGTKDVVGSFDFTVPSDVIQVKIYVAKYKKNASTVTINQKDYALVGQSDDGAYDVIAINTKDAKSISFFSGTSGDKRCMINSIEFLVEDK